MTRIEGKVAKILTERDLVINRGIDDGVEVGMRFKILNPNGSNIRDPDDTSKIIGTVEMTKVIVKVVSVQDHLCVARTFQTIEIPASGTLGGIASIYANSVAGLGTAGGSRVETLRSTEKMASQEIDEADSYIRTGDPAVQIVVKATDKDVEY